MKKLVFLGACALLMTSFTACTADALPETNNGTVHADTGGQTTPLPPPLPPKP